MINTEDTMKMRETTPALEDEKKNYASGNIF
jgi:hypothetical protein